MNISKEMITKEMITICKDLNLSLFNELLSINEEDMHEIAENGLINESYQALYKLYPSSAFTKALAYNVLDQIKDMRKEMVHTLFLLSLIKAISNKELLQMLGL